MLACVGVGVGVGVAALVSRSRRKYSSRHVESPGLVPGSGSGTETKPGSTICIRRGTLGDLRDVARLIRELASFEGSLDSVKTSRASLERDFDMFNIVVATQGGKSEEEVVGFAFFSYGYSTWAGRTVALDDLYVLEPLRGLGIGSRLLASVARQGLEKGAHRMEWLSFKWNERANTFYRSRGARQQDLLYYWRLDEEGMDRLNKR